MRQGSGRAPQSPPLVDRLKSAAEHPEPFLEPHETRPSALSRSTSRLLDFLLGRTVRLLLGAWLLLILAVWLDASGIVTAGQVQDQAIEISRVVHTAAEARDPALLREMSWKIPLDWTRLEQPIETSSTCPRRCAPALGLRDLRLEPRRRGLGLLLSTFWGRRWTGFFALLAAFLALFGAQIGAGVHGAFQNAEPTGAGQATGHAGLCCGRAAEVQRPLSGTASRPRTALKKSGKVP